MGVKTTKWYVGGYRLREEPISPGMGNCDWFAVNKEFPTRKEAMAYIKERQHAMNKYGQVGHFSLFNQTYEKFFESKPIYSKVKYGH